MSKMTAMSTQLGWDYVWLPNRQDESSYSFHHQKQIFLITAHTFMPFVIQHKSPSGRSYQGSAE